MSATYSARRAKLPRRCRIAKIAMLLSTFPAAAAVMAEPAAQELAKNVPGAAQPVERIVVSAVAPLPGLGLPESRLPYSVQSVTARDITGANGGNLLELMGNRFSGVNRNDVQGSPFQTEFVYHGFRASSTLGAPQGISVYLDGVRLNAPFGEVINWDMMPEAALSSVLLVPGSNPAYGLNTMGGSLVMRTKSGITDPGLVADVSFGSDARARGDLSWGHATPSGWHAFAAGTLFREDGWRDHSSGNLGNLFVKAGREWGGSSVDMSFLYAKSKLVGNGLVPSWPQVSGGQVPGLYELDRKSVYTYPDLTRNELMQVALNASHRFGENTQVSALAYVRRMKPRTVNGDGSEDYGEYAEDCGAGFNPDGSPVDPGECDFTRDEGATMHDAVLNTTATRQLAQGLGLSLTHEAGAHFLSFGTTLDLTHLAYFQYEQDAWMSADRGVVADAAEPVELFSGVTGRSRAFGLYASDTWSILPRTHLTGSLRWNHVKVTNTMQNGDGSADPTEQFTYSRLNPALGISQQFDGGFNLYGGVSQSNRVPTPMELGCADPAQPCRLPAGLQADPFLEQVISRTAELGARWKRNGNFSADFSIYRTENRDDILFLRAPNTQQGYFANFGRTRYQGFDLSGSKTIGPVTGWASYSYLLATYDASGEVLAGERVVQVSRGMRLPGLPRNTFKAGLAWNALPSLTLGAEMFAASRTESAGNEDGLISNAEPGEPAQQADWSTGGYAVFNLSARYRATRSLEFYARVNNVFDRNYETYGAVAEDMFPGGRFVQPHLAPGEVGTARFVGPGASRSFVIGMRYTM